MLRSLIAVIIATIAGLAAAKFVEGAGAAVAPERSGIALIIAWAIGAFIASAIALLIGRRWAPLGILATATVLFSASMTIMTFSLNWMLWPAAAATSSGAGYLAIRLLRAQLDYPARQKSEDIFGD